MHCSSTSYLFLMNQYPLSKNNWKKSNNLELLPTLGLIRKLASNYFRLKHFGQTQNTNVTCPMCSEKFAVYLLLIVISFSEGAIDLKRTILTLVLWSIFPNIVSERRVVRTPLPLHYQY